jgi:hypothetical protein
VKIIAFVRERGTKTWLAEITEHEIATITRGSTYAEGPEHRLEVGTVIRVGDHWRRVQQISEAQERLNSAAKSIRAVADLMETIDIVVAPADQSIVEGGAK